VTEYGPMVPASMLEAREMEFRLEHAKAQMQLVRYREELERHGITPPDASAEELLHMWRQCRTVISTASDFVATLGTFKEMLA